jgi:hypothetical protein
MCRINSQVLLIAFITFIKVIVCQNDQFERMPVVPPARRPMPEFVKNNIDEGWGQGLMQTARNFVSSPTGQLAMSMAKEFVSRSAGGNQVLSLNLSSLLILVILKALILTAGTLGAGNWSQYGRGRAIDGSERFFLHKFMSVVE